LARLTPASHFCALSTKADKPTLTAPSGGAESGNLEAIR
jgi:hypothetical protein